jgi:iron complex transport system ATP-binding protein
MPWRREPAAAPARAERGGAVLALRDVRVQRRDSIVLADVHLGVRAGELVALVGPNGAGKSTLLGAIAGDVAATGAIEIAGRPLAAWTAAELALRRAVLPQRVEVAFPFAAADVVRMGRAPWRSLRAFDDEQRIASALADVDAAELAARAVTTLSGGERARIALARVLVQDAQLLLLDEPTAALDLGHQEMVMRVLHGRVSRGDAVVVVLHDLTLAAGHASRVVVIDGGRIVADGPPADVCTPALLSDVYRAPIDVVAHPRTGAALVVPRRDLGLAHDAFTI